MNRRESTINPSERGFGASNALWGERETYDKVDDKSKLEQCVRGLLSNCSSINKAQVSIY